MKEENKKVNTTEQPIIQGNTAPAMQSPNATTQTPYVVATPPKAKDTPETKRMKENFQFFGWGTLLYACFYTFCMFENGSGITFPFFMAGSLLFLCFTLAKLEITLRKGSTFYMVSMMLLAVSTFCTDDAKIINLNKTGIFLLMMSLLLNQFFNTESWKLGKYLGSIFELVVLCIGEMTRPFSDGIAYYKTKGKKNKLFWNGVLGVIIAVPLVLIVISLLSEADALFRNMTSELFEIIVPENIFNMILRTVFIFFFSYMLTAFLCTHSIKEEVVDKRKGEPVLAITITAMLSLIYILFSGIQIFGLFLGKMQLPEGYTYAMYAREGFFQLLTVSILNLIIVLCAMSYFKESKILKIILTVMSFCTFVMIASSAMRMILYISYYDLTFQRIFVLWALAVLVLLFIGVIISIFRDKFQLFRYSMVVVTVFYIALSFSHPDYMIAKVNIHNAANQTSPVDYAYLSDLSADAAPVLFPYMESLDYDFSVYGEENIWEALENKENAQYWEQSGFGYFYLDHLKSKLEELSFRTFNVSRYMAARNLDKFMK